MQVATRFVDLESFPPSFVEKAAEVFLRPSPQYSWDYIVPRAVAQNTFRGFHRIETTRSGAKEAFIGYFRERGTSLIASLLKTRTRDQMHDLGNRVCDDVRARLTNCKQFQLRPYNKIRKPVDLYFEHLVAMAFELEHVRAQLVPLLSLPLDSQILASTAIFADEELYGYGLSRSSTYQDVLQSGRTRECRNC